MEELIGTYYKDISTQCILKCCGVSNKNSVNYTLLFEVLTEFNFSDKNKKYYEATTKAILRANDNNLYYDTAIIPNGHISYKQYQCLGKKSEIELRVMLELGV